MREDLWKILAAAALGVTVLLVFHFLEHPPDTYGERVSLYWLAGSLPALVGAYILLDLEVPGPWSLGLLVLGSTGVIGSFHNLLNRVGEAGFFFLSMVFVVGGLVFLLAIKEGKRRREREQASAVEVHRD